MDITDKPCNAFFSDLDLEIMLGNILENILQHSKATSILVRVSKVSSPLKNVIIIAILENANPSKVIDYGIGLNNCSELCEKYSGTFGVKAELDEMHQDVAYHIKVEITLHDLSSEILNLPKYAEKVFDN